MVQIESFSIVDEVRSFLISRAGGCDSEGSGGRCFFGHFFIGGQEKIKEKTDPVGSSFFVTLEQWYHYSQNPKRMV